LRFSPLLVLLAVLLGVTVENTAELGLRGLAYLVGLPASTIAAGLLGLLAWAWARWALRPERVAGKRWDDLCLRAMRFLPAAAWLDTILVYQPVKPRTWTAATGTFYLAVLAALLALAVWRRTPTLLIAGAAMLAGLALRVLLIAGDTQPLTGDMLALVDAAAADLLRAKAPYHWYHLPWDVPLTYWPGTLLAYLPGRALHLSPRWTNLVAELALITLLALASREGRRRLPDHPALLFVAAAYLLQGPIEWFRLTAQVPGWTLLGAALLATALRHRAAAVAWGLALAASPFAAPFFPLAVVATGREGGWGTALKLCGRAALVMALLVLPFLLWSPQAFFEGTLSWFGDVDRFPRLKWQGTFTWREYPGLAGLFWTLGLERWMQPLQAALVVALVVLFAGRRGRAEAVPAYGVAVFLAFILTNHMLWPYFYQPAIVAALCAVVTARSEEASRAGRVPAVSVL
jgi:hypothetical protein